MIRTRAKAAIAGALILLAGSATTATGAGTAGVERATMISFAEVPTLSTAGTGTFRATVNRAAQRIQYTLKYSKMSAQVLQAHVHLGRPGIAGGISVWLCDTAAAPAPSPTPDCPARRGTVKSSFTKADVIGPTDQGMGAGAFNALMRAVRNGATYVNVHTRAFPSGEIRGLIH